MRRQQILTVEGREVAVSNLDKILYPAAGFTKAQVIDYYIRVSRFLLPHLKRRPVTLKRYPNGIDRPHFYEKNAPRFTPGWVRTFPVPRRAGGNDIRYVLIEDLATLVWSANLANLEIHPFLHRAPRIGQPAAVVFDLDPGGGADILDCAEIALLLKALFDNWKLESLVKVSGSRGLQVYIPLNSPVSYSETQPFARHIADRFAQEYGDRVVSAMSKAARAGKVFIDWSQNSDFKTTVSVYSLRAKQAQPFVSMPVSWEQLKRAARRGAADALFFSPEQALDILERQGDGFAPLLKLRQSLPPGWRAGSTGKL